MGGATVGNIPLDGNGALGRTPVYTNKSSTRIYQKHNHQTNNNLLTENSLTPLDGVFP